MNSKKNDSNQEHNDDRQPDEYREVETEIVDVPEDYLQQARDDFRRSAQFGPRTMKVNFEYQGCPCTACLPIGCLLFVVLIIYGIVQMFS